MKIRQGFVSNSSSSSFVIKLKNVNSTQMAKIKNHIEYGNKQGIGNHYDPYDEWDIEVVDEEIRGFTSMDNFSMGDFLDYIGIQRKDITWGEY